MKRTVRKKALILAVLMAFAFSFQTAGAAFGMAEPSMKAGAEINMLEGMGSALGSTVSDDPITHSIKGNIPAGKIVVVSLSDVPVNRDNDYRLDLISTATGTAPAVIPEPLNRVWHQSSKMTYYKTVDAINQSYKVVVTPKDYLGKYKINVMVVDAIGPFTKLDSLEQPTQSATYVFSNAPEILNADTYKWEEGYYLQRSRIQGNANIFWEHQNQLGYDAVFGVLLWNRESYDVTVALNRRSFKSFMSEGGDEAKSMENAMCGVWEDWFKGRIQEDERMDNFEKVPITIKAHSAQWIHLNKEKYNPFLLKSTFTGVMSISIKKDNNTTLYDGDKLFCDTYVLMQGFENVIASNVGNAKEASASVHLRGSGTGPIISTTVPEKHEITKSNPYRFLISGPEVPRLQSGEHTPLTYYNKEGQAIAVADQYSCNYGIVYRITFSGFTSSKKIQGKIRCNPFSNPDASVDMGGGKVNAGIYIVGHRDKAGNSAIFKKLVHSGQDWIFDNNVPNNGEPVTYYFVAGAMSSLPVEISFVTEEPVPTPQATPKPGKEVVLYINNPMMQTKDGQKEIDPGKGTSPLVVEDRTLIPIRALVEEFAGTIAWDEKEKRVTIQQGTKTIQLWVDSVKSLVNGQEKTLDVVPRVVNDRTLVPLRFVAESFGYEVQWEDKTSRITIRY